MKLRGEALKKLEYLHDAVVETVLFSMSEGGERSIRIHARAHSDCGLEEFNDRVVEVILYDSVFTVATLLGYTLSVDTINIFQQGVSIETERRLDELRRHGIGVPPIHLAIAFSSGSELEVACGVVELVVHGSSVV